MGNYLVYIGYKFVIQIQSWINVDLPRVVFKTPFGLKVYGMQLGVNPRTPFIGPG